MSITRTPVSSPGIEKVPDHARRDATIDAVRAACLLVVVVLHACMVGVTTSADGGIHTSVALSGEPWFVPMTWILQIMPLFFIAGGFVSLMQWRRMRARGSSAGEYIASRVRRLAIPALVMFAIVGGVLLAAKALGADPALIDEASLRIGQPLWFLAVYFGVTSLVPVMAWLHDRIPLLTVASLAIGVLLFDVMSFRSELPIHMINFLLVWPLMQQLGFAMRDGVCGSWSRRRLLAGVLVSLGILFVLISCGWSPDMLVNLNPPTTAIIALGAAQFFALQLLRPRLDAATKVPMVTELSAWVGSRAMGIYLWHMPVILALVVIMWGANLPMPEPHSVAWWATRAPWLLAIIVYVFPIAALAARLERHAMLVAGQCAARILAALDGKREAGTARIAANRSTEAIVCVLLSIVGTAVALLVGLSTPASYLVAVGLTSSGALLAVVVCNARGTKLGVASSPRVTQPSIV